MPPPPEGIGCRVHVLDLATGDYRPASGRHGWGPTWSPDDTRIASVGADSRGNEAVFTVDVDDPADCTEVFGITGERYHADDVAWSPNGAWFAFSVPHHEGGRSRSDIAVCASADGSHRHRLTNDRYDDYDLDWWQP